MREVTCFFALCSVLCWLMAKGALAIHRCAWNFIGDVISALEREWERQRVNVRIFKCYFFFLSIFRFVIGLDFLNTCKVRILRKKVNSSFFFGNISRDQESKRIVKRVYSIFNDIQIGIDTWSEFYRLTKNSANESISNILLNMIACFVLVMSYSQISCDEFQIPGHFNVMAKHQLHIFVGHFQKMWQVMLTCKYYISQFEIYMDLKGIYSNSKRLSQCLDVC